MLYVQLFEQSFEFQFLEHNSDAAHYARVISYYMVTCA